MNRPAVGPQALRGLPNGFPSQQQLPQNRNVSGRLPQGAKMPSNGATWAFGGGVPMGNAGLAASRQTNGPITSFAQTIGASSQSAAPLDLSEFPTLSNNQPQPSQSTWATPGSRTVASSGNLRLQQAALSAQQQLNSQQQAQQQPDDLFSANSQLSSSQGGFRFGNQNAVGQASQSNNVDEFPPLNRNANGDIGSDRGSNIMQNSGFSSQATGLGFGSTNPPQTSRNNGLLNALSGSSRLGNRVASPTSLSAISNSRSPIQSGRTHHGGAGEDGTTFTESNFPTSVIHDEKDAQSNMSLGAVSQPDGASPQHENPVRRSQGAEGTSQALHDDSDDPSPEVQDPLSHMSDSDRWGLKGWSFMMNNFPDYSALVNGSNITNLGFDLNSSEPFSTEIYSLWDSEPSRPSIPHYDIPDCYRVHNVNSLETKIQNFNDEALIFMFYSNPGDMQQVMAAQELHTRNWRYHKKLQQWLTKDDMMVPQTLGNGTERGYYIFFDIKLWQRERRELTLIYDDLESLPTGGRGGLV